MSDNQMVTAKLTRALALSIPYGENAEITE